ncbi:MAG: hypothetical protein J5J06_09550 [Phycisphaerae bacterium]|nr:hypothetical protein [Phycisphaerae bacterium]
MTTTGLPVDVLELFLKGVTQGLGMFLAAVRSLPTWMQLTLAVILALRFVEALKERSTSAGRRSCGP